MDRWSEAARRLASGPDRKFAEEFPGTPSGAAALACIFGASPFLGACATRDPSFVRSLWERGPDPCVAEALANLRGLGPDCEEGEAARTLRVTRRRVALAVGLADIAQVWNLESVTEALTSIAEEACSLAVRILLRKLHRRGALALPHPDDPERDSGLIALGLGKLGGRELNYSSDIDLILLYDPEIVPAAKRYEVPQHLMRLAQWFISMLSEPTVDGQAFRVDLRLRPDPVSTPLVLSTASALQYYSKRGQTWERAAMIKARPIAGDRQAGREYLRRLEGFVWRDHLDFATVQALHDIKKRIDAQHRGGDIGAPGQNIKLGRGGIREIEFFAQTHQLIWGGTNRSLRTIPTCESLRNLVAAGHIPQEASEALTTSYRYLRGVEHRIQMVADKQTHSLPADPAEFETLARFLGYGGGAELESDLVAHLRQVERQYESFFELPREMTAASASSALTNRSRQETVERLGRMGFGDPVAAFEIIERWRTGRSRVARDSRALELLQSLTPALVIAMCGTDDPDLALARFDGMMDRLSDSYRALTLFQANLHVMETVAEIMVAAPAISAILTARPSLVDALLDPQTDSAPPDPDSLGEELAERMDRESSEQDPFDRLRAWTDAARFRIGIQVLFHSLDPLDAPPLWADVADCAVAELLGRANEELAAVHGRLAEGGAAILATGKFGKKAMAVDSPLRIALYYDAPAGARSDGPESLAAPEFFSKLWSRVLSGLRGRIGGQPAYACIGSRSPGSLEELRREFGSAGSGRAAPECARVVARTGGIASKIDGIIRDRLLEAREEAGANAAPPAAREPTESNDASAGQWSVERRPGGLAEIELLAEFLALTNGMDPTEIQAAGTTGELLEALERGGALRQQDSGPLLDAWRLWTRIVTLQGLLGGVEGDRIPVRLQPLFADIAGTESFDGVVGRIDAVASAAALACDRILGR